MRTTLWRTRIAEDSVGAWRVGEPPDAVHGDGIEVIEVVALADYQRLEGALQRIVDGNYQPVSMAKQIALRCLTAERLEQLRAELRAERISYGELAELASLSDWIDPDDVELLEAAGVPEEEAMRRQEAKRAK